MANEIIVSPVQFEWILQTDVKNVDDLNVFIWSIYNGAHERYELFDREGEEHDLPPLADYIPTKAMILDTSDMEFADHYLHLIRNGNCTGWENAHKDDLEEVESDEWYEVRSMFEEMRYNSDSFYSGLQDGDPEYEYAKDVMRALQFFSLTFLDDLTNDDVHHKEFSDGYKWINPPIVKVW